MLLNKYGTLRQEILTDETYFELEFKSKLGMPDQFMTEATVLTTARDVVLTGCDHTDITKARIQVPAHADTDKANEDAKRLRRFYYGLINMTVQNADINPWRVASTYFWAYGMACLRTLWDPHRWPDKPVKSAGQSTKEYELVLDNWRAQRHESLPIAIDAIHPYCVMPDPTVGPPRYVMENFQKLCVDIKGRYSTWMNPKDKKPWEEVEWTAYYDLEYYCYLADDEPVLPQGIAKHNYGHLPHSFAYSGMGVDGTDGAPEKKCVGFLRHLRDELRSESRNFSIHDVVMKRGGWPFIYLDGENAESQEDFTWEYGQLNRLKPGVELKELKNFGLPTDKLIQQMQVSSDYIAKHAAPPTMRGMPSDKATGFQKERLLAGQASLKYNHGKVAFQRLTEQVCKKAARLTKNLLSDDMRVWAQTPQDEFDILLKGEDMVEPFVIYMEFSPIDELDEIQRDENTRRNIEVGLIDVETARKSKSNINPDEVKENLLKEAMYQQMVPMVYQFYLQPKLLEALSKRMASEGGMPMPQMGAPGQPGAQMAGPNQMPIQMPQAGVAPGPGMM